jgi:hypothetical protein
MHCALEQDIMMEMSTRSIQTRVHLYLGASMLSTWCRMYAYAHALDHGYFNASTGLHVQVWCL